MKNWIFFFVILTSHFPLKGEEKDNFLHDLEFIEGVFKAKYAPQEWKKHHVNWDLKNEAAKIKNILYSGMPITTKEYQQKLRTLLATTYDYHVSIFFNSTESAFLPFSIKRAKGRYFIDECSKDIMDIMLVLGLYQGDELLSNGCELLEYDSKPIQEVISVLYANLGLELRTPTDYSIACKNLTKRLGVAGHAMPKQDSILTFRDNFGSIRKATVTWIHTPEEMVYHKELKKFHNQTLNVCTSKGMMCSPLAAELLLPTAHAFKKHLKREGHEGQAAKLTEKAKNVATHSSLGKILWSESSKTPFKAYLYESPKLHKKIGYIRIHSYYPTSNGSEANALIEKLAQSIRYLEKNSDALVVDQVNNPGGLVLYAYAIASLLTDRPLTVPAHQMTLTQKEVQNCLLENEYLSDFLNQNGKIRTSYLFGYPCDRKFLESIQSFNDFVISQWNQQKSLTDLFPLNGIAELLPHPSGSYSKPILFLINELDFSAADFVPAILQDNKRATIFGSTTAGAGGCVEQCSYPNLCGIASFSYTSSFAKRLNGQPIENLGVIPDIAYAIDPEDLTNQYIHYKQAINDAVENLVTPIRGANIR